MSTEPENELPRIWKIESAKMRGRVTAAECMARQFHETYERLAPEYGYETRKDTRSFDPYSKNGKLMIAVCREIMSYNAQ